MGGGQDAPTFAGVCRGRGGPHKGEGAGCTRHRGYSLAHLPTSPHISPHLPTSPHLSPPPPTSPRVSPPLPASPHISISALDRLQAIAYLFISPPISPHLPQRVGPAAGHRREGGGADRAARAPRRLRQAAPRPLRPKHVEPHRAAAGRERAGALAVSGARAHRDYPRLPEITRDYPRLGAGRLWSSCSPRARCRHSRRRRRVCAARAAARRSDWPHRPLSRGGGVNELRRARAGGRLSSSTRPSRSAGARARRCSRAAPVDSSRSSTRGPEVTREDPR